MAIAPTDASQNLQPAAVAQTNTSQDLQPAAVAPADIRQDTRPTAVAPSDLEKDLQPAAAAPSQLLDGCCVTAADPALGEPARPSPQPATEIGCALRPLEPGQLPGPAEGVEAVAEEVGAVVGPRHPTGAAEMVVEVTAAQGVEAAAAEEAQGRQQHDVEAAAEGVGAAAEGVGAAAEGVEAAAEGVEAAAEGVEAAAEGVEAAAEGVEAAAAEEAQGRQQAEVDQAPPAPDASEARPGRQHQRLCRRGAPPADVRETQNRLKAGHTPARKCVH